jgi:hypothetical protein
MPERSSPAWNKRTLRVRISMPRLYILECKVFASGMRWDSRFWDMENAPGFLGGGDSACELACVQLLNSDAVSRNL